MTVSSPFTHWIVSTNANGDYVRGDYFWIPWVIDPLLIIAGFLCTLAADKNNNRYRFFPFKFMFITVLVGSYFQLETKTLHLIGISIAVALTQLAFSLKDEQAYLDTLTGIYNREFMNRYIAPLVNVPENRLSDGLHYALIAIDLDDFKHINDTYGHEVGDDALRTFGGILQSVAGSINYAIRSGGDEFLVFMYTKNPNDVTSLLDQIQIQVNKFNRRKQKPYTLAYSAGRALYHEGSGDTMDSLMRDADEAMYKVKLSHKSEM